MKTGPPTSVAVVYAFGGMVQNCTISGNSAYFDGGGVYLWDSTARNCMISGNMAFDYGGGIYASTGTVQSCTISDNSANEGGGLYNSDSNTVRNCIVYYNQNGDVNGTIGNISYSCLGVNIAGDGNITNEPQFVSTGSGYGTNHVPGNYRLQPTSPCINTGLNQSWMTDAVDLDGRPRILHGVVDMGAYEGSQADIVIMRSPTILSNRCEYGSNATGQTIEVWNAGTGALAYALAPDAIWLGFTMSGTSEGESDLVSIVYASAGLAIGSYTGIVTITSAEACNSPQIITVYLGVDKVAQTITFPAILSQVVTSRVGLAATASSGLPVSFAVASGPGTIAGGTNLSFTAAGTVRVVASQGGDATYKPAPNVTNVVAVERINQTITFPAIPDQTVNSWVGLAATASSGLPVSFAVASGPGTIAGGTNLSFTAIGTVRVVASQGGDATYKPAPNVTNAVAFIRIGQTIYVSPAGNDANNGTSLALAKQTIQEGINVAAVGDTVLVANGTYMLTNQISISPGVTVRSVNGAQATILDGGRVTRCAYLSTNAVLDGFTVMNGYSRGSRGGGVYVAGGTVQNCTISGNSAIYYYVNGGGGGVYVAGGTVKDCTISGNSGNWGGGVDVYYSTVQNCTISGNSAIYDGGVFLWGGIVKDCTINGNWASAVGGGVNSYLGTLENCTISGNSAYEVGGTWLLDSTVRNCLISGNSANYIGGIEVLSSTVENCTISGNSASSDGGVYVEDGTVQNCIVYYNQNGDVVGTISNISYSCIGTDIGGIGNITNEPQFVSTGMGYGADHMPGDYRLRPTSPCINAGLNQSWMTDAVDLDGRPRILHGVVDMGAYEWSATNTIMRSPAILFNWCGHGSNAIGQTIEVWNAGTGAMVYALASDASWLSLSPVSGTSEGESDLVSVNYQSAGLAPGSYTGIVTITSAEACNSPQVITVYLGVDKVAQMITFPPIPTQVVTSRVELAATASSGLPVSFTVVSGPGIISGGTNLTFTATGTVRVVASQGGDATYDPAPNVTNAVVVERICQTIAFPPIASQPVMGRVGLAATASSGLPVSFAVASGPGTIAGGTNLTFTAAGTVYVVASQAGNSMWEAALPVTNAVIVTNNPEPGTVQFSSSSYSVNENSGTVTLTVTRTGGSSGAAAVEYATADASASAGSDYTSQAGTLSWLEGAISTKTITVSITDDSIDENDETFMVTLRNAVGAGLGSPSVATVTIIDNDKHGQADIEVADLKFVPVNLWAGDHPAEISFDLVNDGPADIVAADTQLEITFYLSSNTTFGDGDDLAIGTKTEAITLGAGSQTTLRYPGRAHNTDVTIPEGLSGDYYVFVSVRLVSQSGLSDPDGTYAMRDGPISVRIHPSVVNDYDGDRKSDMMVYDEPSGEWAIRLSMSGEEARFVFGGPEYETVSGDYDGDYKVDPAVHHRKGSRWYIMLSGLEYQTVSFNFGGEGETKGVAGDYNGDGWADPGLYEEGNGQWYVMLANAENGNLEIASVVFFGLGFTPVAGDYDGDGRMDPAVYGEQTGNWYVMLSGQGYAVVAATFGGLGYAPVTGDYDGDGKVDPMLYHEGTGEWVGMMSGSGYVVKQFQSGGPSYIPVEGDYDGDGTADIAVYNNKEELRWSISLSGTGYRSVNVRF